jgi:hypothetical protein
VFENPLFWFVKSFQNLLQSVVQRCLPFFEGDPFKEKRGRPFVVTLHDEKTSAW